MWVWTALSVNESITWISMTINKRVDNPPFRPWGTLVIIWVHVNRSAGVKMLLVSITFSIFFFLFCLLCGGGGGREREEGLLVSSWQNLSIHAIFPVLFFFPYSVTSHHLGAPPAPYWHRTDFMPAVYMRFISWLLLPQSTADRPANWTCPLFFCLSAAIHSNIEKNF